MIRYINVKDNKIAVISDCVIDNSGDALDIMATVYFNGCDKMIVPKEVFNDDFFSLSTGLAGEILQKFSNYRVELAITGDFENLKSRSLSDFIYECNKGSHVFFKKNEQEAIAALSE